MKNVAGLLDIKYCPECESSDLEWFTSKTTVNSVVVEGRLRSEEVSTKYVLGCNGCSETIKTVSENKILQVLNSNL